MDFYADIVKPVAARKLIGRDIEQFAAGLGGEIVEDGRNQRWNRSVIAIRNDEEDYTYECQTVLARCSACGRRFYDITFTDNDGSVTGCPHCNATLNW